MGGKSVSASAMIEVTGLIQDYPGTRALDGVSFTVAEHAITALVGANGAGKTTLLRCLAALDEPVDGDVEIDGIRTSDDPRAVHQRLGYLSDSFGLYEALTVRQCLLHQAAMHNMDRTAQDAAVDKVLERMRLGDLVNRRSGALSRGQRQRLAIGQAIVHDPKVLLLDEPASGLDPEARWRLSSLLTDMARDGMTLIVSSHILSELEDYCTHVLALRGGKVILDEPIASAVRNLTVSGAGAADTGDVARACIRIQTAAGSDADLEGLLSGFPDAVRTSVHGTSATVFIPDSDDARVGLLRHLVDAAVPVVHFGEDKARMQELYFASLGEDSEARDAETAAGTAETGQARADQFAKGEGA